MKAETTQRPRSRGTGMAWTDTARTGPRFGGSVVALERELRRRLRGEVRFDGGSRALYATDASNYRQVPIGVVIPRDTDDVMEAVAVCRRHGAPITHRGAGTSLAGQTCNVAVIIDHSKYLDRIVDVDPARKIAVVEPGVRRDQLAHRCEREHGLTFAPDTSTHAFATFGGMIGNNACGVHSVMAGRTDENVEAMEVLTYDGCRLRVGPTSEAELERIIRAGGRKGDIYRRLRDLRGRYADVIRARTPDLPRLVSGYYLYYLLPEHGFNVARALVGTEGTCVTILEATLRLVPSPPCRALLVLGYPDVYAAGDHIPEIHECEPIGLEGFDDLLVRYMHEKKLHLDTLRLLPDGKGFLFAEFGGETEAEAVGRARRCAEMLERRHGPDAPRAMVVEDHATQRKLWEVREAGLAATAHLEGETWPGWEDSAVPPGRVGDYLRALRALYRKYGYTASVYGHFGQGCIHTRVDFDLRTAPGIDTFRRFVHEASDLCLRMGGSLSAEHGDGQARAELLPKMYGEEMVQAFREFKAIWDPEGKMNPGKVVDPYRVDAHLRLGADYDPPRLQTHFRFPEDRFDFGQAALRCVGVGKCRQRDPEGAQVMCPSFVATHEEKHTTRGRARLLFEMLNGDETPDAWDNDDVFEALDLCLSCKGCKHDCPVNVDMATYKAEFLSHYYERHLRPRHAYAMGLIHWWARLAAHAPGLANAVTRTPALARLAKAFAGLAPERPLPAFAPQTFQAWFARRGPRNEDGPRVVLFPDTFTNHFKAGTAKAAVEVLEGLGYHVVVPRRKLCCGRPLYEFGWIELARRLWTDMIGALHDEIRAGTPIVGLEPSCVSAFRDELPNLFPHDEDARRLHKSVLTLGEFVAREDVRLPPLDRKVLVHGHCHHKSIMGLQPDTDVLGKMGVDFELIEDTCCGLAGAFGFVPEHYDVSMACGEHHLLPAVRAADPETIVLTDGFSCREQIAHGAGRRARHLAEVLHMALFPDQQGRAFLDDGCFGTDERRSGRGWLLAAGAFAAATVATWAFTRNQ